MKSCIALLFFFWTFTCSTAQDQKLFRLLDAISGEPLEYVIINSKSTGESYLSNTDGYFRLTHTQPEDTLKIDHPGYENKSIRISDFLAGSVIGLTPKGKNIAASFSNLKDKDLVKKMKSCLNKLENNKSRISKTFVELTTHQDDIPVEYLRFYYNSWLRGAWVYHELFKAGQVATSIHSENIFYTFNPIEVFKWLNFFNELSPFPKTPFLLKKEEIHNSYKIKGVADINDPELLHIICTPLVKGSNLSAFEIWINKHDKPVKFRLSTDNTALFPIIPALPGDAIKDYRYDLEYIFDNQGSSPLLKLIKFNYAFSLNHLTENGTRDIRNITTTGILHFYHYNQQFSIPDIFYILPDVSDDYKRAAIMLYDSIFWNRENTLVLSKGKSELIEYFGRNGALLNFGEEFARFDNYEKYTSRLKTELAEPTLEWNYETYFFPPLNTDKEKTCKICIPGAYYIDFNLYENNISTKSKLLLFTNRIKYYNDGSPERIAYFRIHMDLLEYRRQIMIQELQKIKTLKQAYKYLAAQYTKIKAELKKLQKDTKSGEDIKALRKWNDMLAEKTGRDHFAILGLH